VPTPVQVTVEPDGIALAPGESAEVTVTIQNASQVVEHFATSVLGLPRQDLYSCEPSVVMLRPREVGTVRVRISIPERSGPVAGRYTLGVLVTSPYQREVSRCEELVLDVRPVPALTMAAQPEVALGGATGGYALSIANEGNTPLAVTLTGRDQENRVGFEFEPRELRMAPGMVAQARLAVRADAPLTGQDVRRAITVRAHAGELTVERPLTFTQRPRIAGGLLRISGIAAGVALLAGATVGGALLIRGGKQNPAAQAAALGQHLVTQPGAASATPTKPGQATSAAVTPPAPPSTTAGTPSSQAQPSTPPPPATAAKVVDFTRTPDGRPDGDQIIQGDLYAASGVTLSTVTENAPPDCRDATALALRTAGTFGSFLTSARPAGVDLCNTVPVRMDFAAPVRLVHLNVIGIGAPYVMSVQLNDGRTDTRTVTPRSGAVSPIDYEPPAGTAITSIVYAHASTDPTAKDPVIIKSVAFTPA
jgi:hypothetical protein